MIEDVLELWFGKPATTTEEYGKKIRRWFMGGPALDAELRERFGSLVERAIAGELDAWATTPRGRLALIVVLDQFTRSIFRDTPRMYAGDAKAQALALDGLDRGFDEQLGFEERQFLGMPLAHAEDLALQERSVTEMNALVADAADFHKPLIAMGVEQSRKYRDLIAKFGRFPHRNKLLGRTNTPEEEAFLVDVEAKMRPAGANDLPA